MVDRILSAPLLIALFAIALGCTIDAVVKAVASDVGLHHLLAWRFLFGSIIAVSVFRAKGRAAPTGEAIRFHTLRGLIQLFGAFTFFYALTQLPLAEATIIGFTAALMVGPIAWLALGEPIGKQTAIATLIGFAGAALAVSGAPEETTKDVNRLYGLTACFAAAFGYALILVMLRMRAVKEDATTIAMFTNVVPAIALLPVTMGTFGPVDWGDIPLFIFLGFMGYATWYLMTLAYARAQASKLAPMDYSALIWSAMLGAVFFNEIPRWQTWAGGAIIVAACLWVGLADHFRTRREAGLPSSDIPE